MELKCKTNKKRPDAGSKTAPKLGPGSKRNAAAPSKRSRLPSRPRRNHLLTVLDMGQLKK
jgi:hypothetical protein